MLSSADAHGARNFDLFAIRRAPSDMHMQSAIATVLPRHGVLRCQWHARPKAATAPVEFGVLRHHLREARLADCFSQKQFDSLIQFAEEFRFSRSGEQRRS